jgi:hypothetical protein
MSSTDRLTYRTPLAHYQREAERLFAELKAGDENAAWRFKWMHSRFKGGHVDDVRAALDDLRLHDAHEVIAHDHAFETWSDLVAFTREVADEDASPVARPVAGAVARFEAAVEAVVDGDVDALRRMLADDPALVHARSSRRHHATLLHYVAANGVEGERQRTPPTAVAIARLLLEAGAEPDALADMYDQRCTTMSMLVSSEHPAKAGVQVAIAEALLDHGAAWEGPGTEWRSAVMTALVFGFPGTAQALVARGAPVRDIATAAGLGRVDDVRRLLPAATPAQRHAALALAAQLGQAAVVRELLDAGESPDRYNPDGYHSHATPLHHAALLDHLETVQVLVERGARLDVRDTLYRGTPLDWALYAERSRVAEFLRERTS